MGTPRETLVAMLTFSIHGQLQGTGLIKGDRSLENAMKRAKNRANQMLNENNENPDSRCAQISLRLISMIFI
jgi:hypothetical protein